MSDIYIFEIHDNDNKEAGPKLMLYENVDSLLNPFEKQFKSGISSGYSFDNLIEVLNDKKIKKLTSYTPGNYDTLCTREYEITDFTDAEILHGSDFHQFDHLEFYPSENELKIFEKHGITITNLDSKESSKLEETLKTQEQE